ncbi:MAG: carotenoid oxygenase family protein [Ketobacter sp.]
MAIAPLMDQVFQWFSEQAQKRVPVSGNNPYLKGAYAPVDVETTSTSLKVQGQIPEQLNGVFTRIGPNPISVPNPATHHWFIGEGMVHGLRLENGKAVWYRNRWIGTNNTNRQLNRPLAPGKRHGINDTVNTNIIRHGGSNWAMVEAGALPVELDDELETLQHSLFNSNAVGCFSAHPHLDPLTGELHAICYDAKQPFRIFYHVIDQQGQLSRRVSIPVKHGPMVHDCAITTSQTILLDLPVTFSMRSLIKGARFPYQWNKRHRARVGLLPRLGNRQDVRWFHLDPCYVFHTCNAFDANDGSVVVDVVVHQRMFDNSIQGPEPQQVTLERWTLPPDGDQVQRKVISSLSQEFPRFDERLATRAYRYIYTVGVELSKQDSPQPLYRHDVESGARIHHDFGPQKISGEVIFIPRSDQGREDDGWLLSYVYDLANNSSEVVILNADDLDGEPQAIIKLPVRVPLGFHGNWLAD